MHIVEFTGGTLRFLDHLPAHAPASGFIWIYLEREDLDVQAAIIQKAAQHLGGSPVLDVHLADLRNPQHPSGYDDTSIYDLVVFRRLATDAEVRAETANAPLPQGELKSFAAIRSRAVGFVAFDRLLVSVHPASCYTADIFIKRFLGDAVQAEGLSAAARNRLPANPADLMLRMINVMVDSYLELRKQLNAELDVWQRRLLSPQSRRAADWRAYLTARTALHSLEDLCEGQHDAMQEWLDTLREQPPAGLAQAERDGLLARARDVIEHVQRVLLHVRRMEQGAETAIQIHFSALSHRTNEIMRVLTALTAVFLPLNFITGFFGMNFEYLPLIHSDKAMWVTLGIMLLTLVAILLVFWRKRYLDRTGR